MERQLTKAAFIYSLVMSNQTADPMEADMETIEEDEDRFITCNSFRDNRHQKRWSQSGEFSALCLVGGN